MNKSLINEQMLTTTLYINTGSLNKDIDNVISVKLQEKVGDISNYLIQILKDIKIIKRSIGEITTSNGLSHVKYIVTYKCDVLVPCQGHIIDQISIHRINKLGVISYIKLKSKKDVEKFEDSPLN